MFIGGKANIKIVDKAKMIENIFNFVVLTGNNSNVGTLIEAEIGERNACGLASFYGHIIGSFVGSLSDCQSVSSQPYSCKNKVALYIGLSFQGMWIAITVCVGDTD